MIFSLGEKVRFTHESGYGIIKKQINTFKYLVENEFGIDLIVLKANLVKIHSEHYTEKIVFKDKIESDSNKKLTIQEIEIPEIDLHIDHYQSAEKQLTSAEILNFQLRKADEFTQKMLELKISNFVIIHGRGEGILKNKVRSLLTKYSGIDTSDANFAKYGKGATLVRVNYKYR